MPEALYYSHFLDLPAQKIMLAGADLSVMTDAQKAEVKDTVVARFQNMSVEDFFAELENLGSDATHATGWMLAWYINGALKITGKAKYPLRVTPKVALHMPDAYIYMVDECAPSKFSEYLPAPSRDQFWMSKEEAVAGITPFLARVDENGPLVNIAAWLNTADTDELEILKDSVGLEKQWECEAILDALSAAYNPDCIGMKSLGRTLTFDRSDYKNWVTENRADVAADIDWSDAVAPAI